MFDFGLRLRQLREERGLSQEQLGKKVDRSKSVISSYENNLKMPPLAILAEFALIFNVSLDYLVGIDKNQMISVNGLTKSQSELISVLVLEFKEGSSTKEGLTTRQQHILSELLKEFSKKQ